MLFFNAGADDLEANNGPLMNRVAVAMMALSLCAVVLRFVARRLVKQPLLLDDWMIVVALVFSWVTCILFIAAVENGQFGRHAASATAQTMYNFFRALYIVQITYLISIAGVKFSILLFYRRIFNVSATKIPLLILACIEGAWLIATVFVGIFSCSPIDGFWEKTKASTCIPNIMYFLGVAIPNIVTDIALLIFPMPLIWQLKITRSQKIALSGILLVAGFIIIISCLRLVSLIQLNGQDDFSWALLPLGIWTAIETNVGIFCACLLNMRPLLRLATQGTLKSTTNQSENSLQYWPGSGNRKTPIYEVNNASFELLTDPTTTTPEGYKAVKGPRTATREPEALEDIVELAGGGEPKVAAGPGRRDVTWSDRA